LEASNELVNAVPVTRQSEGKVIMRNQLALKVTFTMQVLILFATTALVLFGAP
jgi:hypothetical protein